MNPPMLALLSLVAPLFFLAMAAWRLRLTSPPEPKRHIAAVAGLGVLSIVLIGLWCWPFDRLIYSLADRPFLRELYNALLLAAIPEELSRWLILRWRLGAILPRLSSTRCLLLGGVAGLGLVMLENVAYALDGDLAAVLARSITATPFHMLAGSIVGYFVGYSLNTNQFKWSLLGVLLTVALHGVNNYNPRIALEMIFPDTPESPSSALASLWISGWPQNIATLAAAIAIVFYLARYRPFSTKAVQDSR